MMRSSVCLLVGAATAMRSVVTRRVALASLWSTTTPRAAVADDDDDVMSSSPEKAFAATTTALTDEMALTFESDVGIELASTAFARTTLGALPSERIAVARVLDQSPAALAGVAPGWLLVSANGKSLEGVGVARAAKAIATATRPLHLVFRNPELFTAALSAGSGVELASTRVLEAYPPDGGEPQVLAVKRLKTPDVCGVGAQRGDLLEVRYEGRLQDGRLFDGSAVTFAARGGDTSSSSDVRSVPGRAGDSSLYFVLGAQPVGQFPVAWDPAMTGACVGEVRAVRVPPVLGFQDKGSPKRGVPPFATVFYTLQLVSINGNYLPR